MEYEEHKEKLIYALAKRYSLPYHCEGTYYDILWRSQICIVSAIVFTIEHAVHGIILLLFWFFNFHVRKTLRIVVLLTDLVAPSVLVSVLSSAILFYFEENPL